MKPKPKTEGRGPQRAHPKPPTLKDGSFYMYVYAHYSSEEATRKITFGCAAVGPVLSADSRRGHDAAPVSFSKQKTLVVVTKEMDGSGSTPMWFLSIRNANGCSGLS